MLTELRIQNFAIIEDLTLELGSGLVTFTVALVPLVVTVPIFSIESNDEGVRESEAYRETVV